MRKIVLGLLMTILALASVTATEMDFRRIYLSGNNGEVTTLEPAGELVDYRVDAEDLKTQFSLQMYKSYWYGQNGGATTYFKKPCYNWRFCGQFSVFASLKNAEVEEDFGVITVTSEDAKFSTANFPMVWEFNYHESIWQRQSMSVDKVIYQIDTINDLVDLSVEKNGEVFLVVDDMKLTRESIY